MSKRTQAKNARRKKRQAARDARPVPVEEAGEFDLTAVDEEITSRGWEFDVDNSTDEIATWFFPPSGVVLADESLEPVTRIWLAEEDTEEWHVVLVGSGEGGTDYVFSAESLLDYLDEIEEFRLGGTPAFG